VEALSEQNGVKKCLKKKLKPTYPRNDLGISLDRWKFVDGNFECIFYTLII
jgi:hypothetical protein